MDPSKERVPTWAIEKLHKELDGEENYLGEPICWGQPEQDEEKHRKYWDGFMKTDGLCKICGICEGEWAVCCWLVCCPFATCSAYDRCCGDEYKKQLKERVPGYMKMVWILYRDHMVNIGLTRTVIFHLANIDSIEITDSFRRHTRIEQGCLYNCVQERTGKMEGIVVNGCDNRIDGLITVSHQGFTQALDAWGRAIPGQWERTNATTTPDTYEGWPTYSRMMQDPQAFAVAANKQIKDCKEVRCIAKEPEKNELAKDFAARKKDVRMGPVTTNAMM